MNKQVNDAIKFLYQHYNDAKKYVEDSEFYTEYNEEKIHHSMQVVGAMKYIMKHEKTFQNRDEYFLQCAMIATILHDVGRFEEIKRLYDAQKSENKQDGLWVSRLDHGAMGYEILKNSAGYNDPRIYIPVKHHGNMIEELYADEEFYAIKDEKLKKDIVEIIFLTRDADKTANFYLMTYGGNKKFPNIFKNNYSDEENARPISQEALDDFTGFNVVKRENAYNYVTRYLNILSWIFDINYLPSFDLIIKNGSLSKMADIVFENNKDEALQEVIENAVADYLNMRYEEKIREL